MDFKLNLSGFDTENKLKNINEDSLYEIIIIGGGPAGLTASVYCMRKGIKTALIVEQLGGQVAETSSIENYTGYRYIEGMELVGKFRDQIKQFELDYIEGVRAIGLSVEDNIKYIRLSNNKIYRSKAVIIATGKSPRKLNIPGEKEFIGKGVAFCAICDAPLYKNKNVAVVGGGNSGIEAAIDLAKIANHVTVLQRSGVLTADKILIDKLNEFKNIEIIMNAKINRILGDVQVKSIDISLNNSNDPVNKQVDGVFVEIGLVPNTDFVKGLLDLNSNREIIIDSQCHTNINGIFAAGDVTNVKQKQIIIAAGEGAKAALSAYEYFLKS
jgi:alkyl hydroperoxide reductase subunit F